MVGRRSPFLLAYFQSELAVSSRVGIFTIENIRYLFTSFQPRRFSTNETPQSQRHNSRCKTLMQSLSKQAPPKGREVQLVVSQQINFFMVTPYDIHLELGSTPHPASGE